MRVIGGLGRMVWAQWDDARHAAAVIGTALYLSLRPRHWARTVRNMFAREVLAIGVEPLAIVCGLAVLVGIMVVAELAFWVGEAAQSQLLGPLLVAIVARELGPALMNIVVIVRNGSVVATELGIMKIDGRIHVLEAQGIDPFTYLVMPRVLAAAVSTFCLTVVFILVAFASGFLFGAMIGKESPDWVLFLSTVSNAVHPTDVFNVVVKSVLPALFASATCCIGGLGVGGSVIEVPPATQRALVRSIAGVFVISAAVSLLTYL